MNFIKKNLSNILFVLFIIFLFTPYGLPVRSLLIKGVSIVKTKILPIEMDEEDKVKIDNYNWELEDVSGNRVNFTGFQNKVIVVNFWATWCPPCIAEMPGFQKLYDEYGDRVSFVFVANDKKDKVQKFIQDKSYTFPVFFQVSRAPQQLQSSSLPTTYFIDTEGRIHVNEVGAADWNSDKVKKVLDRLLQ